MFYMSGPFKSLEDTMVHLFPYFYKCCLFSFSSFLTIYSIFKNLSYYYCLINLTPESKSSYFLSVVDPLVLSRYTWSLNKIFNISIFSMIFLFSSLELKFCSIYSLYSINSWIKSNRGFSGPSFSGYYGVSIL